MYTLSLNIEAACRSYEPFQQLFGFGFMQIIDKTTTGYFGLKNWDYIKTGTQSTQLGYYAIVIQWQGFTEMSIDNKDVCLEENQVYCMSPGSDLSIRQSNGSHSVYLFNKQFYCVELHDAEASCNGLLFNGALPGPLLDLDEKEQRKFALLHQVFLDEMETEDSIQAEMIRVLLKRLIIKCARIAKDQILERNSLDISQTDTIRKFNALVERNFRQWHKVQDYAEALFKSPKTLSNLFGQYAEQSPLAVIHGRIVLEARRLLHYTNKTSKEIAFELGFEDAAQFNKLFKKATGDTPIQFRQEKSKLGRIDNL